MPTPLKRVPRLFFALLVAFLAACGPAQTPTVTATVPQPTVQPTAANTATLPATATVLSPTSTLPPTATAKPTLGIGSSQTSPKDGMVMMYVPAGSFLMGSDKSADPQAYPDELPQHTVTLDAFWIDQTEVTNAMFAQCVAAGSCKAPSGFSRTHTDYYTSSAYADFPVINTTWDQANAYCSWAGRVLPSEAQWEKAARGTDGRIYPWGNQAPDKTLANFNSGVGDTTKVGSYPAGASPYGALDMAGNAYEWVADWYSPTYYQTSPANNPTGPAAGDYRVLRGGSWTMIARYVRVARRLTVQPGEGNFDLGFRCAAP